MPASAQATTSFTVSPTATATMREAGTSEVTTRAASSARGIEASRITAPGRPARAPSTSDSASHTHPSTTISRSDAKAIESPSQRSRTSLATSTRTVACAGCTAS
jgi:hypothetical protein